MSIAPTSVPLLVETLILDLLEDAGLPRQGASIEKLHAGRSGADTYAVSTDSEQLVVKVHPASTEDLDQRVATQRVAAAAGIAPAVRWVSAEHRAVLSDRIIDQGLLDALQSPGGGRVLTDLGRRLAQLHQCDGAGLEVRSPLDQAAACLTEARHAPVCPRLSPTRGRTWSPRLLAGSRRRSATST